LGQDFTQFPLLNDTLFSLGKKQQSSPKL